MFDAHVAQQVSTLFVSCGGVDLGSGRTRDRDCGLAHPAGGGVDEHLVAGLDPRQVLQPVPRGGAGGGHCRGLGVGQPLGQSGGQAGVAGDERGPAAVGRHAADPVTDLEFADPGPDRAHHPSEIGAQLRLSPVEGLVAAEGDQHVGEVDAGRGDGDLDLSRARRDPVERGELQGLQVTGSTDL